MNAVEVVGNHYQSNEWIAIIGGWSVGSWMVVLFTIIRSWMLCLCAVIAFTIVYAGVVWVFTPIVGPVVVASSLLFLLWLKVTK